MKFWKRKALPFCCWCFFSSLPCTMETFSPCFFVPFPFKESHPFHLKEPTFSVAENFTKTPETQSQQLRTDSTGQKLYPFTPMQKPGGNFIFSSVIKSDNPKGLGSRLLHSMGCIGNVGIKLEVLSCTI